MKPRISVFTSVFFAVALIALYAVPTLQASGNVMVLDNSSWKVEVEPDSMAVQKGEKEFRDTLVFANGKVTMAECQKMGFDPTEYSVTKDGEKDWTFTTEQESDSQGKQLWTGTVHGDDIRGKMIRTKKDGTVLTYKFEGSKLK